ncbi:MAG: hypothetical protein JXX28_07785 [Deltaproteobacteria bacterium]|nr:hypothetical protein [Deltaproteobacteria bacterium]
MNLQKLIGSAVLTATLLVSSTAWALSVDEIMNMYNVKVPVSIIVQTIDSSGTHFTTADVRALSEGGADPSIVEAVRRHAVQETAPTAPPPQQAAPATPASSFDSADELGGVPEESYTGEVGEPEDTGPVAIEEAIKRYRAKKYLGASLGLYDLLQQGTYPDQESKIQYYLARTLFDMGMYHSSQYYFMQVVRRGPNNPYFKYALPKLVAIAKLTGNNYELMRIVAKIPPQAFPRQARNHLFYLMGVKLFDEGELSQSAKYLQQVSPKSDLYLRAKYIEGEIHNERGKLKSSVKAFRDVYQAEADPRDDIEAKQINDLKDLSLVNIARIYYGLERYENATNYYKLVDRQSTYWPESLYERAWTSFVQNDINDTLGLLLTVHSPYYSGTEYLPEATYLRALSFFQLCEFAEAEHILLGFEDTYKPMRAEIKQFVGQYSSPEGAKLADQAYDAYFSQDHRASTLSESLFLRVLRNRELSSLVNHMELMDDEVGAIEAQKSEWQASIGVHLKQIIEEDRQRYKRKAGAVLLQEMSQQYTILGDLMSQSQIVRFEIVDAQRQDYEYKMSNPNVESAADMTVDYSTSKDIIYWPFNGEFWTDELGYYKYTEHGSCQ